MKPWVCGGCSTRWALKLTRCPRCHGIKFHQVGTVPPAEAPDEPPKMKPATRRPTRAGA